MAREPAPRPRRWLLWASGSLAIMAGCAELPGSAQVAASAPPVPSGLARVWFYRPLEPSESLNLALIDMNGSYVGAVANGSAFYRDVRPGYYRIAPESWGRDFNQDTNVALVSGQQLYIKIVSLESWAQSVSGSRTIARDTFYAWLIPPAAAQAEMAGDRSSI
jgi:Protein of unknown function (DUF2846)